MTDGRTDGQTPITPKCPPPQVLANAVMVYNSTPNYFITKTPYYLLMGISMDMFEFITYFSQWIWMERETVLIIFIIAGPSTTYLQVGLVELDGVNK